jgi:hypothetical protein
LGRISPLFPVPVGAGRPPCITRTCPLLLGDTKEEPREPPPL